MNCIETHDANFVQKTTKSKAELSSKILLAKIIHRCDECNKKLDLLPVVCKCNKKFCSKHVWPNHNCSFDYRKAHQMLIRERNPSLRTCKVDPI